MAASQIDRLGKLILQRRTPAHKILLVIGGLIVATGVRWSLDRGVYGVPFLTFYPVVLLAALLLGGRYAVLSAVLALGISRFLLAPDTWPLAEVRVRLVMFLLYCMAIGIIVMTGHFVRLILIENRAHIDEAEAFNAELQHRAKNALQILRALIGRAPREGEDIAAFQAKVLGRMEALGKANELLRYGSLEMVSLADLVATATAPFDQSRFSCTGPAAAVHKSAATPLVMALHELATNALKYGALSGETGRVEMAWQTDDSDQVVIEWREHGGPRVSPPTARGFGSRLLRPHAGLTDVTLDWAPTGLVCRMALAGRLAGRLASAAGDPARPRQRRGLTQPGYTAP